MPFVNFDVNNTSTNTDSSSLSLSIVFENVNDFATTSDSSTLRLQVVFFTATDNANTSDNSNFRYTVINLSSTDNATTSDSSNFRYAVLFLSSTSNVITAEVSVLTITGSFPVTVTGLSGAYLIFPDSTVHSVNSASYSARVGGGSTWSCKLPTALVYNWDDDAEFKLIVPSSVGTWTSPPLHATQPEFTKGYKGDSTDLKGIDATSWKLSAPGQTLPNFNLPTAGQVIFTMAQVLGVLVTGAPNILIPEWDVQGGSFLAHMGQILADLGYTYRIGPGGEVQIFESQTGFTTNRPLLIGISKETWNLADKFTYLRFIKRSKYTNRILFTANTPGIKQSALPNPMDAGSVQATDLSTAGFIQFVAFFDGPSSSGNLCRFIKFDPTIPDQVPTSTNPAQSISWSVHPDNNNPFAAVNATLLITGVPSGAGPFDFRFQGEFPFKIPTINPFNGATWPTARDRIETYESTIWPTKAFLNSARFTFDTLGAPLATTVAGALWLDKQRGLHTATRELAQLNPFVLPGDIIGPDPANELDTGKWIGEPPLSGPLLPGDIPAARIEATSFTVGPAKQTLSCWIPTPPPFGAGLVIVDG